MIVPLDILYASFQIAKKPWQAWTRPDVVSSGGHHVLEDVLLLDLAVEVQEELQRGHGVRAEALEHLAGAATECWGERVCGTNRRPRHWTKLLPHLPQVRK